MQARAELGESGKTKTQNPKKRREEEDKRDRPHTRKAGRERGEVEGTTTQSLLLTSSATNHVQNLLGVVSLDGNNLLLADSLEDGDLHVLLSLELLVDLVKHLGVDLVLANVLAGVAVVVHEEEEAIVDGHELPVLALHNWDHHVVGGGGHILVLLASEDVHTSHVHLGVTVLAGLQPKKNKKKKNKDNNEIGHRMAWHERKATRGKYKGKR